MPISGPLLGSKAFGDDADRSLVVAYRSHQEAMRFLYSSLSQPNGIALLQGPRGAGKTTTVNELLNWKRRRVPVAMFDGAHAATRQLVSSMLLQFGVEVIPQEDEQMLQTLGNFLSQKARSGEVPVLIVDNADRLGSSTLSLLNWLANLDAQGRRSLRFL